MKMQAQSVSTYLSQKAPRWPDMTVKKSFYFQSFLNSKFKFCKFSAPPPPPPLPIWHLFHSNPTNFGVKNKVLILATVLLFNIGLSINSESDETLSASQSKFMEENMRDIRLWLNHSWLRVHIFKHHVVQKKQVTNTMVVCVSLNSIHPSFLLPYTCFASPDYKQPRP